MRRSFWSVRGENREHCCKALSQQEHCYVGKESTARDSKGAGELQASIRAQADWLPRSLTRISKARDGRFFL